jgi:hypothetical protein
LWISQSWLYLHAFDFGPPDLGSQSPLLLPEVKLQSILILEQQFMSNGESSAKDDSGWVPQSKSEKDDILVQLERILADPLFLNSKRYPGFLSCVVSQTLDGHANQLKERTLGIQVFGREPDYDTSLDNVVRSTAGEIRRRLAQYYQDPAHRSEIRIDLPAGSYVPRFQSAHSEKSDEPSPIAPARKSWLIWTGILVIACIAALIFWQVLRSKDTSADRLWKPVLEAPGSVLLCVGSRPRTETANPEPIAPAISAIEQATKAGQQIRDLPISSATALARLAGYLQLKGKPFRIREDANTVFADLRDGPVVLIGAFINQWTARLTGNLRFTFRSDTDRKLRLIFDGQSLPPREWANSEDVSIVTEDYALVSRFLDQTTGRIIVVAAGLHRHGTVAAGEFLTDPASLTELAGLAPQGLDKQNLQVVLAAKIIGNNSGKPRILATHFW